jgi:hypothetical protein
MTTVQFNHVPVFDSQATLWYARRYDLNQRFDLSKSIHNKIIELLRRSFPPGGSYDPINNDNEIIVYLTNNELVKKVLFFFNIDRRGNERWIYNVARNKQEASFDVKLVFNKLFSFIVETYPDLLNVFVPIYLQVDQENPYKKYVEDIYLKLGFQFIQQDEIIYNSVPRRVDLYKLNITDFNRRGRLLLSIMTQKRNRTPTYTNDKARYFKSLTPVKSKYATRLDTNMNFIRELEEARLMTYRVFESTRSRHEGRLLTNSELQDINTEYNTIISTYQAVLPPNSYLQLINNLPRIKPHVYLILTGESHLKVNHVKKRNIFRKLINHFNTVQNYSSPYTARQIPQRSTHMLLECAHRGQQQIEALNRVMSSSNMNIADFTCIDPRHTVPFMYDLFFTEKFASKAKYNLKMKKIFDFENDAYYTKPLGNSEYDTARNSMLSTIPQDILLVLRQIYKEYINTRSSFKKASLAYFYLATVIKKEFQFYFYDFFRTTQFDKLHFVPNVNIFDLQNPELQVIYYIITVLHYCEDLTDRMVDFYNDLLSNRYFTGFNTISIGKVLDSRDRFTTLMVDFVDLYILVFICRFFYEYNDNVNLFVHFGNAHIDNYTAFFNKCHFMTLYEEVVIP